MYSPERVNNMIKEQNVRQAHEIEGLKAKCKDLELANKILAVTKANLSLEQIALGVLTGLMAHPTYDGALDEMVECSFKTARIFIKVRDS